MKGIIQFYCTSTIATIDLFVLDEPLLVDMPSLADAGFRDGDLVEVSTEDDPDAKVWMELTGCNKYIMGGAEKIYVKPIEEE